MIYDLPAAILSLQSGSRKARMVEAAETLPDVGIVALNGVPFVGSPPTYFGVPVTEELIYKQLKLGMGFGGVLTFMNTSQLSLNELESICVAKDHDWAMRNMTVTLCFAGCPTFVEMSFARDRRFHMSWVEYPDWKVPRVFTATGTLKEWAKYLRNRDDNSFLQVQRDWLEKAYSCLLPLYPSYL